METENRVVGGGCQGFGGGENGEVLFNRYRRSVWEDEKNLEMDSGDSYTTM